MMYTDVAYVKEYAQALHSLACEEGKEEMLLTQLEQVVQIFEEFPEYEKLLANAAIKKLERIAMIETAFAKRCDPDLVSFLKILTARNAIHLFIACAKAYRSCYYENHAILPVIAETAIPMEENQKEQQCKTLSDTVGKQILLTNVVNPDVMGGVRLTYDGVCLDGSLAGRFAKIREQLMA